MNPDTAAALAEAFGEHRASFGVPITLGSRSITAIVGENEFARELAAGGFAEAGDLNVKLLLSDLPAPPAHGDPATYQGRSFRVSQKAIQPGGLIAELTLRPASR
jgi:hypothetical protein